MAKTKINKIGSIMTRIERAKKEMQEILPGFKLEHNLDENLFKKEDSPEE